MTTIVCKKLAKMGTHMNPRKSKICLSNVEINCNVNKTYKIFLPLHEGMSNSFFFDVLQFHIFFFLFHFRFLVAYTGCWSLLIQFWDWIGLGPQGPKLFWGRLGPQGPKCFLGSEVDSGFWLVRVRPSGSKIGSSHRCGWPKPQIQPKNTLEKPKWT